ncbi:MAG TPA: class I SAM-dependent methyltransferase [Alphaproteobacteria bacterium]
MSRRFTPLTTELYAYIQTVSLREPDVLRRLRDETAPMKLSMMQITPEQGQFMALLARLLGVKRYLEVGTFTGYSTLAVALALPPDGRVVTCDVNAEWTSIARRYWREAGVADRIELVLQPAIRTLDDLIAADVPPFDFAFIDADKENYDAYYERVLRLVRAGGVIAIDNVLWGGAVVNPASDDKETRAIDALNRKLLNDLRVDISLVPIGDGLMLARKR